jgi:hypothetical protein
LGYQVTWFGILASDCNARLKDLDIIQHTLGVLIVTVGLIQGLMTRTRIEWHSPVF